MEQDNNKMNQTTEINNKNDIDRPDAAAEWLVKWRNELPYNIKRYTMIVGFIILVLLVVYLGYARGALDVCNDLGGRLEIKVVNIQCHPDQYNITPLNDDTFIVPRLPIENVD